MADACRILVSLSPHAHCTPAAYAPAPLLHQPPTHPALFHSFSWCFSLFPFLWHVNFAFSVAQEMASAETGVFYPCLPPKLKFLSRHVPNESSSLTFWINALTTVLLFKAGHQCCNAPHQLACSCYATVHAESSTVYACQECSARSPAEMRKDCLASDLVGSQMQTQRLMWAENILVTNECSRLKRERRIFL